MIDTTAFFPDGRYVEVPAEDVADWQYEVANLDTHLGLADWHIQYGDPDAPIEGTAEEWPRCEHDEKHGPDSVLVTNQPGDYDQDRPHHAARVCPTRHCILEAMAWVERGTGEQAHWSHAGNPWHADAPTFTDAPPAN